VREREAIVSKWGQARAERRQAVLATVVRVEGSAYRGLGARMLVLEHGERVGSISGGCLEHEVTKKAFWLTAAGPTVAPFSTRREDETDETKPYGMGCEGVVHLLLERVRPDAPCLSIDMLAACREALAKGVLATVLARSGSGSAPAVGDRLALWPDGRTSGSLGDESLDRTIARAARECLRAGSFRQSHEHDGADIEIGYELVEPPRCLIVFGAGDDAQPVVRIAKELGWHVSVADGRAHYATAARFPLADRVIVTDPQAPLSHLRIPEDAACVVMTHSFEQDQAALAALALLPLGYLGLLGPVARREALLEGISSTRFACKTGLHSPIGFDIGSRAPEEIALAIVAEAHAALAGRTGGSLRDRVNAPPK
jgi:xanthine/CO dehydrogenase XdhC/CoxF family maturation factor